MKPVYVWTSQISQHHFIKKQGIHLLDTTVKSGILAYAPSFLMVMDYKNGVLSQSDYTALYEDRMDRSMKLYDYVWKSLLAPPNRRVAVACYCAPGQFCHRHLFLPRMQKLYRENGRPLIYMGEMFNYQKRNKK